MTNIAYYAADIQDFLKAEEDSILGALSMRHGFSLEHQQKHAWQGQIQLLRKHLSAATDGWIYFEFSIPRMGKRADVVIASGGIVFVIEFKVGSDTFDRNAIEQVFDYSLDLKNFHKGSHSLPVVPVLIATAAHLQTDLKLSWGADQVAEPMCISPKEITNVIELVANSGRGRSFDIPTWSTSGYQPTP